MWPSVITGLRKLWNIVVLVPFFSSSNFKSALSFTYFSRQVYEDSSVMGLCSINLEHTPCICDAKIILVQQTVAIVKGVVGENI